MGYQFSTVLDDTLLYERVESFGGGMDGFNRATLLPPDVSQYFENVHVADNLEARTRPGLERLGGEPVYLTDEEGNRITTEDGNYILLSGGRSFSTAIQSLCYFDTPDYEQLLMVAEAKIFAWSGSDWSETALAGWSFAADSRIEFAQGVNLVLGTDGTNPMRSYNGTTWSASLGTATTATGDPPVGATILCWHAGRMFASGNPAENDTIFASFLLQFGTGKWNHTNFKWRVGQGEGDPIVALASMQDFNLCVLKQNSVWLVNTLPTELTSASNWNTLKISSGSGCVGRKAWAYYQNDLFFMSQDGVRSVKRMQGAAGQYDVSPPISQAMQPYIDRINWSSAHLIVTKAYKHLIVFAVPLDSATTPDHVLVFNARLNRWTGVWTGWDPNCFEVTRFGGVQRLVVGEQTGLVRQWKDFEDATDADTYTDDGEDIPTKIWTRAMLFGEPVNDKDGYHAELRFSASDALVTMTVLGDNVDLRTWNADLRPSGTSLPVNLPFDLYSARAITSRRGLRGMPAFNELFLKIESTEGWFSLRNATFSAYLNMLQNE